MARRTPPKLLGVLKRDDVAAEGWVFTLWALPDGHKRIMAQKAVVVGKEADTGDTLTQMRLVDLDGHPVEGLDK